jgi:NRAMP (natural resistance-associated macrophage protein)-like metal ion transporter
VLVPGTLAGQVVMEGFIQVRMRPWLRRLVTRTVAIIPAAIVAAVAGPAGAGKMLVLSQARASDASVLGLPSVCLRVHGFEAAGHPWMCVSECNLHAVHPGCVASAS